MSGNVLLVDESLCGFPYGMQRDFEEVIVRMASAERKAFPERGLPKLAKRFTDPATRYGFLSDFVPKKTVEGLHAKEMWLVLMGPEANPFWFLSGWERGVGTTILYLYDTFEAQLPLINRMLSGGRWDCTITSFPAAVPMLENATKRKWHAVMQGVNADRFYPLDADSEPTIAFSSYGRRWPPLHDAIKLFCKLNKLHYDFTVASDLVKGSDPLDNYEILAWHMRQSWFTVGWPVELTNPKRVLSFSPITCRWFEAAASCAVVIGQAPTDPAFTSVFGDRFVEEIDPHASVQSMVHRLSELWEQRHELRSERVALWRTRKSDWTWEERVREIQNILVRIPLHDRL